MNPRALALTLLWSSWLVAALMLGLLGVTAGSPGWVGEIAVLMHFAVALLVLGRCYPRRVAAILGLSLALRTVLMFWDLNFRDIFSLPNSGADSEMFFRFAVAVAADPSLVLEEIRGGVFSKAFGLLFWVTGVHRPFAQYTNVLLGLSAVLIVEAIMARFPLDGARRDQVLAVGALLPNPLIMSAIFLRESVIMFLIAVSAYFFVRWFRGGKPANLVLATAAVLAASTFHAGVIAVGVGYMVVVLVYQPRTGRFGLGPESLVYLALFAVIIQFIVAEYPDVFLGKFEPYESAEDLLTSTNRRAGGSQYLTGLAVNSYADMIRVGPLRALYFLGSPMPWDSRGLVDLFTFMTDSLFYLGSPMLFFFVRKRLSQRERALGYALLFAILVASLVFGAGVSNAGTAVRHRFKLVSLFMILLAVCVSGMRDRRNSPTPGRRRVGRVGSLRADAGQLEDPMHADAELTHDSTCSSRWEIR